MRVKVTQEHIDNAIASIPHEANPLSIAMLDGSGSFHVIDGHRMVNTEVGWAYRISPEASAFVLRWQAGEKVEPCEVEIAADCVALGRESFSFEAMR